MASGGSARAAPAVRGVASCLWRLPLLMDVGWGRGGGPCAATPTNLEAKLVRSSRRASWRASHNAGTRDSFCATAGCSLGVVQLKSVHGGARERFITEVALLEECRGQVATACARRRAQLFCVHHQCRCYNCTRAKRGEDRGRPYACEGEWGSPYRSMKRKRRFFRPSPGASTHRLSAPCGRSLALTRPLTGLRL